MDVNVNDRDYKFVKQAFHFNTNKITLNMMTFPLVTQLVSSQIQYTSRKTKIRDILKAFI